MRKLAHYFIALVLLILFLVAPTLAQTGWILMNQSWGRICSDGQPLASQFNCLGDELFGGAPHGSWELGYSWDNKYYGSPNVNLINPNTGVSGAGGIFIEGQTHKITNDDDPVCEARMLVAYEIEDPQGNTVVGSRQVDITVAVTDTMIFNYNLIATDGSKFHSIVAYFSRGNCLNSYWLDNINIFAKFDVPTPTPSMTPAGTPTLTATPYLICEPQPTPIPGATTCSPNQVQTKVIATGSWTLSNNQSVIIPVNFIWQGGPGGAAAALTANWAVSTTSCAISYSLNPTDAGGNQIVPALGQTVSFVKLGCGANRFGTAIQINYNWRGSVCTTPAAPTPVIQCSTVTPSPTSLRTPTPTPTNTPTGTATKNPTQSAQATLTALIPTATPTVPTPTATASPGNGATATSQAETATAKAPTPIPTPTPGNGATATSRAETATAKAPTWTPVPTWTPGATWTPAPTWTPSGGNPTPTPGDPYSTSTSTPGGGNGGGATSTPGGGNGGGATSTPGGGNGGGATSTPGGGNGGGATSTPSGGGGGGATSTPSGGGGGGGGATSTPGGGGGNGTPGSGGTGHGAGTPVPPLPGPPQDTGADISCSQKQPTCDEIIAWLIGVNTPALKHIGMPDDWFDLGGWYVWMSAKFWLYIAYPVICFLWYIFGTVGYWFFVPAYDIFLFIFYFFKQVGYALVSLIWPVVWTWDFIKELFRGMVSLVTNPGSKYTVAGGSQSGGATPTPMAVPIEYKAGYDFIQSALNGTPLAVIPYVVAGVLWFYFARWALAQFSKMNS